MSLHHAILGLLSSGSMTGDELACGFARRIRPFWESSPHEVRRSLDRLVQAGLVDAEQDPSAGDPVFRLSYSGRTVLEDWMASDPEVYPRRDVFLVRLSLAAECGPEAAGAVLADRITIVRERLADLRDLGAEPAPAVPGCDLRSALATAAMDREIAVAEAELAWAVDWHAKMCVWPSLEHVTQAS